MDVKLNESTMLNVIRVQKGDCLKPIEIECCKCPLSGGCHNIKGASTIADVREHRFQLAVKCTQNKKGI